MDVFDLFARIRLDSDGFQNGLKDAGGAVVGFMKSAIANFAEIGKAFAGLAKESLDAYSSYEQLVGGIDTLFKDSSQKVQEYAENAYKTAGMSANDYMDTTIAFSASLIQGLQGDTEKAADISNMAITDMADNVNKMGTSMEMVQNTYRGLARQNFSMLDNLSIGYQGTAAEMARLINDSKVMGDSFVATADNVKEISFDKYIEAIHAVQDQMGITGTTSREAASTIEGSTKSMQAAWENLVAGLGKDNVDLDELIENFVSGFETVASNIVPRIGQIAQGIGQLIQKIAPTISRLLPTLFSSVVPVAIQSIGTIVGAIMRELPKLAPKLVYVGAKLLGQIYEGMTSGSDEESESFIETFVDALITKMPYILRVGTAILGKIVEGLIGGLSGLAEGATAIITSIADYLEKNLPALTKSALEIVYQLVDIITNPSTLITLVKAAISIVTGLANAILEPGTLNRLLEKVPEIISNLVTAIVEAVPLLLDAATEIVTKIGEYLFDPENIDKIFTAGAEILLTLIDGLGSVLKSLYDWIMDTAEEIADYFGFGDYWRAGKDVIDEFMRGVKEEWDKWANFWEGFGEYIYDALHNEDNAVDWENYIDNALNDTGDTEHVGERNRTYDMRATRDYSAMKEAQRIADFVAANRIQGVPVFGDGGIVTKPTLAMIGDDGAEAVVPLEKDSETGRMFGGISISFGNIYVQGGQNAGQEVVRQIDEALRVWQIQQKRGIGGTAWQT